MTAAGTAVGAAEGQDVEHGGVVGAAGTASVVAGEMDEVCGTAGGAGTALVAADGMDVVRGIAGGGVAVAAGIALVAADGMAPYAAMVGDGMAPYAAMAAGTDLAAADGRSGHDGSHGVVVVGDVVTVVACSAAVADDTEVAVVGTGLFASG